MLKVLDGKFARTTDVYIMNVQKMLKGLDGKLS